MTLLFENTTSLERVSREVVLILNDELNDEIAVQEAAWADLDAEFATRMGRPYTATTIEPIGSDDLYWGHRPSLLDALERFPNVSVMAFDGAAQAALDTDQTWGFQDMVHIEVLVKARESDQTPELSMEELVNRRIQRTVDAIVTVLGRNRTLAGLVLPIEEPPSVVIQNVVIDRPNKGRGERYAWQGATLDYTVPLLMQTS